MVNKLLKNIKKHLSQDKSYEKSMNQIFDKNDEICIVDFKKTKVISKKDFFKIMSI